MLKLYMGYFSYFLQKLKESFTAPQVSVEYPYITKLVSPLCHTSLKNDFSECTGCLKCEEACPVDAIHIEGFEYSPQMRRPTTSQGIPFERELEKYQIDYSKCVFCGICVQTCPTGSLSYNKSLIAPVQNEKKLVVDLVHVPRTLRVSITKNSDQVSP